MMADTLPGLEMPECTTSAQGESKQEAVRVIERVKLHHLEDLDRLREVLQRGGTYLEMRAAVDAYRVLDEVARGIEKAADLVRSSGPAHRGEDHDDHA